MTMLSTLILAGLLSVGCLVSGIWVVRRRYGAAWHVLGIVAIVVGLLLASTTVVALFGIAVTTEFQAGS